MMRACGYAWGPPCEGRSYPDGAKDYEADKMDVLRAHTVECSVVLHIRRVRYEICHKSHPFVS